MATVPMTDEILDKLHGIAVQLGSINEFLSWMRRVIEEERKEAKTGKTQGKT